MSARGRTTWLFDLDNTLHDASHAAFGPTNLAMTEYIALHLKLPHDEAWALAARSLDGAIRCRQRKHETRALRLQGAILAAQGRLEDAVRVLTASLERAGQLKTPRESWIGQAALGEVLTRLGRDREAEAALGAAADAIESTVARLAAPERRRSFLAAEPVARVFRVLGRTAPRPE